MELVLNQKQELGLVMTFQLRQAIELLQYSTYDLYQYIKEQELENPLIELEEPYSFRDEKSTGNASSTNSYEDLIEYVKSHDACMREELFSQAKFLYKNEQDQQLLNYLIHNLKDNGYLSLTENEYYTESEIDRGIQLLQQVGPIGIGARSLQECLLLQITYNYPEESLAASLIENHLDLLANRKWNEIARCMKLSLAEVKNIYDFIKTLNPNPCTLFSDSSVEYLNPDIIVEFKDEKLVHYLNEGYLPEIHFNKEYSGLLNAKDETSKYINNQYNSYKWLLSSIEQRRLTILKIVGVLVEKQETFFKEGFQSLKPLTLKEVADEIDMHESTVSRATMNKVLQTPQGSFDLRMLFTSKLDTSDGSAISQTKVKTLLENFIENEDKYKPLSDQKIADYFNKEKGIRISRRTISKYREELNIPPSSRRREISV
ncbi:RNA polymerase factor sigma-54 [Sporosarcina jiandibaonis]|uniref:RNA polymerase factor sigma-54 n=1 Tax=Sporosarcina jiandibaonis TaxID=2715535 RepID=UPI00155239E0|nr:RNA polymerase factor sigma-54 [Sporosarcina jiandibaonis]